MAYCKPSQLPDSGIRFLKSAPPSPPAKSPTSTPGWQTPPDIGELPRSLSKATFPVFDRDFEGNQVVVELEAMAPSSQLAKNSKLEPRLDSHALTESSNTAKCINDKLDCILTELSGREGTELGQIAEELIDTLGATSCTAPFGVLRGGRTSLEAFDKANQAMSASKKLMDGSTIVTDYYYHPGVPSNGISDASRVSASRHWEDWKRVKTGGKGDEELEIMQYEDVYGKDVRGMSKSERVERRSFWKPKEQRIYDSESDIATGDEGSSSNEDLVQEAGSVTATAELPDKDNVKEAATQSHPTEQPPGQTRKRFVPRFDLFDTDQSESGED